MKKRFLLLLAASVALFVWAENRMNFFLEGGLFESINLSQIDTIRFSNGNIVVEGAGKSYAVTKVDSATFTLEDAPQVAGDTVFVTYNGSSVTVDNPFAEVAVATDGANVTITSNAQKKGIVYYLSGASTVGSFNFTPDKGYTLVLDELNLSNDNAPIVLNKSVSDDSYVATVHLRGDSYIEDGASNSLKAALYTKSKLKISVDSTASSGSLNVKGNVKHAINSAKRVEVYSGSLNVTGAVADGINADGLEMYGGQLSVSGTGSDGVDCSEVIYIAAGTVVVNTTAEDSKGLKCDSLIDIEGGNVQLTVDGAGSKAIKSSKRVILGGGEVTATLNAASAFVDTDGSYSYNGAVKADSSISITGGTLKVTGAALAARALSSDLDVEIAGGTFIANLTGAHSIETSDTTSVFGIKADGTVYIKDGTSNITIGTAATASKGIKANKVNISGGNLTIVNDGKYFSTTTSSSSSSSGSSWSGGRPGQGGSSWGQQTTTSASFITAKAIKTDTDCTITGGTISLTSNYGKGITSDGTVTLGVKNGSDSDFTLDITAGSDNCGTTSSSSSSSGWGGMGNEAARTKYNGKPKGISTDGEININAGTINIKAYDTGILSTSAPINVNGGTVYIDAQNDQGIFAKYSTLTFNGGFVKVTKSYEAFSGKIMTFNEGSSTYAVSSDDAWNATDGSESSSAVHIYVNGGIHYAIGAGDGLDSNGDMTVTGGIIVCSQTGNGNSPIDMDSGWTHTGGFVLACGGSGMFSESVPSSSAGHIYSTSMNVSVNQYLIVANESGSVLAAFKVPQSAQAAVCAYNSEVTSYKFYVGSSYNGTMNYFDGAFGLYETNRPTISTGNYTAYSVSTANGNSGGGGRW